MVNVISEIAAAAVSRDVANYPHSGFRQDALIIPGGTLDPLTDITLDGTQPESLISDIVPSAAAVLVNGIGDKRQISGGYNYTNSADTRAGCMHFVNGVKILDPSVETRESIKDWIMGAVMYS